MKEETMRLLGQIAKKLPKGMFHVRLMNGHIVTAAPAGKLRSNKISLLVGDWVDVELSAYDVTRGRITWRYIKKPSETAMESR